MPRYEAKYPDGTLARIISLEGLEQFAKNWKGMAPGASPFNWEMGQIYQAGRQGSVNFVQGGQAVPNPFH